MSPPLKVYAVGDASASLLKGLKGQPAVVLVGSREAVAAAARLLYQEVLVVPSTPAEPDTSQATR